MHAVDLTARRPRRPGHVLIDLGQPAAQGADGPLQRGIAVDQGLLVGEVPDAVAPVLQVDVAQIRASRPTRISIAPQCRPPSVWPPDWPSRPGPSPRLLLPGRPACGRNPRRPRSAPKACAGAFDDHAARHVQAHVRPTSRRRARRRTCRGTDRDPPLQVRPQAFAVFGDQRVEAAEEHAVSAQRASRLPATGELSKAVDCPARSTPSLSDGTRRLGSRVQTHRQGELVQPEQPNVGPRPFFLAPAGPVRLGEDLPGVRGAGPAASRLVARCQKRLEGSLREGCFGCR